MKTNINCPNCGKPLARGALEGLCADCMLKMGAGADSFPEPPAGPTGTVVFSPACGSQPRTPVIGHEFGGYRLVRRLGHGGMGVVYEAEEKESGRRVALKVVNQKLTSPADRARFLREGRLAASINHPNCVYVFGTEEIEGTPVITMEFVSGGNLQQRFAQEGPLPVGRAVDAMVQVIEGLAAAQAVGILHRDIKPSNCFEDATGAVKIGDFGLSISTLPREETNITETGAMVGTPAFCSPEQHRGEELDARTDMYAVGVTLYYLLTGKLPFEGQTMPQLIANTLEKRAQSPRVHRKEIPDGLARVILRCLHKHPSERFKNYGDLRRALEPYGSTAPTPATFGLRLGAGMVDFLMLGVLGQIALLLIFGDPFSLLDQFATTAGQRFLLITPWFVGAILYYALTEWYWGATPGKALCRLRVVATDRSFPPLGKALLRAIVYTVAPVLPYWMIAGSDPLAFIGKTSLSILLSLSVYGMLALLFATARRSNGFAAVHDLLTGTRVVSRAAVELRPALPASAPKPANIQTQPQVGPYHVLEPLGKSGAVEWVMGYDLRLLRRVLLRIVPPGTSPLPEALRQISRAGRLRWLTGRREAQENWDAFEGAAGQPLLNLTGQPQPWARVRFWLHDLAEELDMAAQDASTPEVLGLNRVWITSEGRAKLFDVPVPGTTDSAVEQNDRRHPTAFAANQAPAFLAEVARVALSGNKDHAGDVPSMPLARHAQKLLVALAGMSGANQIATALKPLLLRTAEVTRLRRAMIVFGCMAFPLLMSVGVLFGLSLAQSWREKNPELMQLSDVMNIWKTTRMPWIPQGNSPSDEQFGLYVASRFRGVITNEAVWNSALARTFISGDAREFAENSLVKFGAPTSDQLADAEAALNPIIQHVPSASFRNEEMSAANNPLSQPGFPAVIMWSMLLIYVGLPAIIAALCFRGGLVLLAAGVTYVLRDGRPASRLRLFWRSLVCWSPAVIAVALCGTGMAVHSWLPIALSVVLVLALVVWSLLLPRRGLQDCLAGTWPVPR